MFVLKLHHIGIVVQNINESLGEISNFLNFESTSLPTTVGSQKVDFGRETGGNVSQITKKYQFWS